MFTLLSGEFVVERTIVLKSAGFGGSVKETYNNFDYFIPHRSHGIQYTKK